MSELLVATHHKVVVDRGSIVEWCRSGPLGGPDLEPLARDLDVQCPATDEDLVSLVAGRTIDEPIVIVTRAEDFDEVYGYIPQAAERRIVWVEMEAPASRRSDARPLIRGRGVNGYHWAVRTAHWRWQTPFETISYGDEPENVGELRLPAGEGPFPVAVVIHGGYYREQWERDTSEPTAVGLTAAGIATWNIEYRRTGPGGDGGWPNTFEDVAAAIDHLAVLAQRHPLDLARVVIVGHSAGGQLALWAGARDQLPESVPGGQPVVMPSAAISLAGVVDLAVAAERGVGFGHNPISAVVGAMPSEDPSRYALVSPPELKISVPQVLIQGVGGDDPDLIDINRQYAACRPEVTYIEIAGADHFDITYPSSSAWQRVVAEIRTKAEAE